MSKIREKKRKGGEREYGGRERGKSKKTEVKRPGT